MKECTVCKEIKSLDEFYNRKASDDGKGYRCKPCDDLALRCKYNLEIEEYDMLVQEQNNKCRICDQEVIPTISHDKLIVDHNHKTGKVRGLLCHKCNKALGLFKDSITIIQNAIKYLEKSS